MTIITKVGASYIDHMNDVLEVNSFLTNVTRVSPPTFFFWRRKPGMNPLSCPHFVTTKGGQEKFPGKRATVFLQSDDTATNCMFLHGYYSRTFRKPADINDGWIRYV